MKIAFPTQMNTGLQSIVYGHFGSAPFFVVADTADNSTDSFENPDRVHLHGQCQPLKALNGRKIDAVVVGGIGSSALRRLNSAGVRVYRAVKGTVADNLSLITAGQLPEFDITHTCSGHDIDGGCSHIH